MGRSRRDVYPPDPARAAAYDRLFAEYRALHDHFGRGGNDVMHRLRALRDEALPMSAGGPRPMRAAAAAASGRSVGALHAELLRCGPGRLDRGNVSRRVPGEDLMVIKPSGVAYEELTPEQMIVCDLDGTRRGGESFARPATPPPTPTSTGTCPDVGGVVHTHSPYATAWAARGEPIPCVHHRDGATSSATTSRSARSR